MLMKPDHTLDDNLDHNDDPLEHPHCYPDKLDNSSDGHPDSLYKYNILLSIQTILLTILKTILTLLGTILTMWIKICWSSFPLLSFKTQDMTIVI